MTTEVNFAFRSRDCYIHIQLYSLLIWRFISSVLNDSCVSWGRKCLPAIMYYTFRVACLGKVNITFNYWFVHDQKTLTE